MFASPHDIPRVNITFVSAIAVVLWILQLRIMWLKYEYIIFIYRCMSARAIRSIVRLKKMNSRGNNFPQPQGWSFRTILRLKANSNTKIIDNKAAWGPKRMSTFFCSDLVGNTWYSEKNFFLSLKIDMYFIRARKSHKYFSG